MTPATSPTALRDFARRLHGWGAVVTAIRAGTKHPAHRWQRWQTEGQTKEELDGLPWRKAAAVGVINGRGDFRVFDIDALKDEDGRPLVSVPERVVVELLLALGLPDDYQWSYRSGSGAGFGVVIRCQEALPPAWPAAQGVYVGEPAGDRAFGQLELRWATGQTVIDGAHPTGPGYRWRLGSRPFVPPALRTAAQVVRAFTAIAEPPVAPAGSPASPPASPLRHRSPAPPPPPPLTPVRPPLPARYAAAALADASRQVATTPPGGRNNALFRQTAGLAELVNGGLLARPAVEQVMAGEALAAGLTPRETRATIASAFKKVGGKARGAGAEDPLPNPLPRGEGAGSPALREGLGEGAPSPALREGLGEGLRGAKNPLPNPLPRGEGAGSPALLEGGGARLDDTGNAERFTAQHGEAVRFNHSTGHWLLWAGTHWRRDDDGAIQRRAKTTARSIYDEAAAASRAGDDEYAGQLAKWARASAAEARRNAMLSLARSELPIPVTHDRLNRHDRLLNARNGTLDLATGQLRPHARDDLLTYALAVDYDPAAECPTWDRFIARITGGDDALAGFLARAVGYTLSGRTGEQCLFFLYGHGANGKSTFIETVLALLGELGHKARAQILLAEERERVPNEIAALAGKRLVVASELAEGSRLNEGLVKDMTGGDSLSARFLYGEPFTFKPAFKLWLYGNHKPVITGTDDGIWRRVRLIPFPVQIPEAERDPGLPGRLRAELPGILAWAVRGWAAYQRQGLGAPAAVTQATAEYRGESDLIGVFLDERCVTGAGLTVGAGELYAAYGEWATANGLRALSNVRFGRALAERGVTKTRVSSGRWYYEGLGLGVVV